MIRTSFITGFPGETDADFDELLSFVKDFRFDALGVFAFSPEEGTPAATMPDAVAADLAVKRAEEIMVIQQELAFEANDYMIDRPIEVLVDGVDHLGQCVGRYYGQAPEVDSVCYLTEPVDPGTFAACNVVDYEGYDLIVTPQKQ